MPVVRVHGVDVDWVRFPAPRQLKTEDIALCFFKIQKAGAF